MTYWEYLVKQFKQRAIPSILAITEGLAVGVVIMGCTITLITTLAFVIAISSGQELAWWKVGIIFLCSFVPSVIGATVVWLLRAYDDWKSMYG